MNLHGFIQALKEEEFAIEAIESLVATAIEHEWFSDEKNSQSSNDLLDKISDLELENTSLKYQINKCNPVGKKVVSWSEAISKDLCKAFNGFSVMDRNEADKVLSRMEAKGYFLAIGIDNEDT